ncbi:actin binding protein [Tieghemiomyces parasiticus]|uniref:Actin binding protein n=1 Tax=Tieghemiomyces parasiticus TaxID=78921 RepID=A0A9W8A629_9FUNG|nr:actin binding protein [Tieghemiomyces parasiticus]
MAGIKVNFSTFSRDLVSTHQRILSGDEDISWALYGYDKGTNDLKVLEEGAGDLDDLSDEFDDGKIQYAFVRVQDSNTGLPKFAFISWCGSGVPVAKKGLFGSHLNDVSNYFKGYHVQIDARDEDDVSPDRIRKKISESSGARYSVHNETKRSQEAVKPVGSVYKKTEIPDLSKRHPVPAATSYSANEAQQARQQELEALRNRSAAPATPKVDWEAESRAQAAREAEENARQQRQAEERAQREQEERQREQRAREEDEARDRERQEAQRREEETRQAQERERQAAEERKREAEAAHQAETQRREREAREREEQENQRRREREAEAERQRQREAEQERVRQQAAAAAEAQERQREEAERTAQAQAEREAREREAAEAQARNKKEEEEADRNKKAQAAEEEAHLAESLARSATVSDPPASSDQGTTARVLYDYEAEEDNELTITEGELVIHIEKLADDWWHGFSEDGQRSGMFPANYVEEIEVAAAPAPVVATAPAASSAAPPPPPPAPPVPAALAAGPPTTATASPPAAPPAPPLPTATSTIQPSEEPAEESAQADDEGHTAVAQFDFDPSEDNELGFVEGDRIVAIEFVSDEWWQGVSAKTGHVGLFPSNYVELEEGGGGGH